MATIQPERYPGGTIMGTEIRDGWLKLSPSMAPSLVGSREFRPHDLATEGWCIMRDSKGRPILSDSVTTSTLASSCCGNFLAATCSNEHGLRHAAALWVSNDVMLVQALRELRKRADVLRRRCQEPILVTCARFPSHERSDWWVRAICTSRGPFCQVLPLGSVECVFAAMLK